MKRKLKLWLERWFSRFPPYQVVVGGMRSYQLSIENAYAPKSFLHYGRNVRIEAGVNIAATDRLHIGDNVGIGQNCAINAVGGCYVGNGCMIAAGTTILTTEHGYMGSETIPHDLVRTVKPVYLEDYVWIGAGASILPGVRIGTGAIVGMGSVVFQDVPPLAIVVGNPAKVIMYRPAESFRRARESGAPIDAYAELTLLKVPPFTRRKYANELKYFGFDISGGHEYFRYFKHSKPGKRLVPVPPEEVKEEPAS